MPGVGVPFGFGLTLTLPGAGIPGVGVPFGFGATLIFFGSMPGTAFPVVFIGLLENSGGKFAGLISVFVVFEVVLELEPLRMGALLEELEAAKLIEAHRFRADLIRRAILESMPTTTQALLFWRMAEAFERRETGSLHAAAFRHQAFRLPNGLSKSTRLFEDTAGRSALGKRFWNQPLDSLEPEPRNGYKTVS